MRYSPPSEIGLSRSPGCPGAAAQPPELSAGRRSVAASETVAIDLPSGRSALREGAPMAPLTDLARTLFDAENFAVLSTLEPDGRPHSTVVWVKRDGDDLLFALPKSRRKIANLRRDPRAAVAVFDPANPYESVQVQGTATLEDDPAGN